MEGFFESGVMAEVLEFCSLRSMVVLMAMSKASKRRIECENYRLLLRLKRALNLGDGFELTDLPL
jgi:hypothetical protein